MRRRKAWKWIAGVSMGAAALVLAGFIVIQTAWFHDWLRRALLDRTRSMIDGQLAIDSLTGDVLRGLTLHGVVLSQQGRTIAAIPAVSVEYDVIGLLRGRYTLRRLDLDRPIIQFDPAVDRSPLASSGSPATPAQTVTVDYFSISGGAVTVGQRSRPAWRVSSVTAHGSAAFGAATTVGISDLIARDDRTGVEIRQFMATASWSGSTKSVQHFHTITTSSEIDGRGSWNAIDQTLDVDVHSSALSAREVAAYVSIPVDRSLSPRIDARASGPLAALHVNGSMSSSAGQGTVDATLNLTGESKRANGTVAVTRLNPAAFTGRPDWSGNVTARASLDVTMQGGDFRRAVVKFDVRAADATAAGFRAQHLSTSGVYRASGGAINGRAVVDTFGAHWDVHGSWAPAARSTGRMRYVVAGQVRGLHPAALRPALSIAALDDPRLAGTVNGRFQVSGSARTLEDQDTSATIDLTDSTLSSTHISSLHLGATAANTQLTADLDAQVEGLTSQSVGFDRFSVSTTGAVHAHVVIPDVRHAPTPETLQADVSASLGSTTVAGLAIDRATIDASIADGAAHVRQLDVTAPNGSVTASGTLAFQGREGTNLTYTVDVTDLQPFGAFVHHQLQGRAHSTGTITGSIDATHVTGEIGAQQIHVDSDTAILTANLQISGVVPQWRFGDASGTVEADGSFVTMRGVDFEHVSLSLAAAAGEFDVKSVLDRPQQSIAINAALAPHPDWHEIQIRQLAVGTPGKLWTSSSPDIVVRDAGGEVTIGEATFVRGNQRVSLKGRVPTSLAGNADVALEFEHLQIADLNSVAKGAHAMTGELGGSAHVSGTLADPRIDAKAEVTGGSVDTVAFERAAADFSYQARTATIDAQLVQSAANTLTIKGHAPLDAHAAGIDLQVQSSAIDVRLLQPLVSGAAIAAGTLEASATITGSRDAPVIQGSASIADAAFSIAQTGIAYQRLNARATFSGDNARIETLTVEDGDRHVLTAQGGFTGLFNGARAIDVTMSTSGFHVLKNKLGQTGVDATLHVTGSLEHPDLSGQIHVDSGRLDIDAWLAQLASTEPDESHSGIFDRSTWNLTLDIPNNVIVRGQPAGGAAGPLSLGAVNATIGGHLTLTKIAGGHPAVNGRLAVIRGTYMFQNRPFQVDRDSSAEFRGRHPVDPDLSITAERQSGGATIDIHVTGTAGAPRVTLSSDPPLDQGDILALILFDEPVNSLGQADRATLTDRAASMAETAISGPLSDALARAFDLDLVQIQASSDTGAGPTLAIGQQIGSNLYVRVQQGVTDSQDSQLSIEYQISKLLRLVTTVAQNAPQSTISRWSERSGVDLIFVIRY